MEEETMAVKIRLRRMGQKKAPFYRVFSETSETFFCWAGVILTFAILHGIIIW